MVQPPDPISSIGRPECDPLINMFPKRYALFAGYGP
jgi:hypothetical protein